MELLQGKRLRLRTNHRGTLQAWKRWPDFTGHQLTLAKLLEFFCWSSLLLNNDSFDGGKTSFFQVQDDLSWMRERTIKEEMKAGQASIWTTISLLVCLLVWLFFFFFPDRFLLYSPGWSRTHHEAQDGFKIMATFLCQCSDSRDYMWAVTPGSPQLLIVGTPILPVFQTNVILRSQDYVKSKETKW